MPPSIRITLEQARASIERMFHEKAMDYDKDVRKSIDRAIECFDFDAEVRKIVHKNLRREIGSRTMVIASSLRDRIEKETKAVASKIIREEQESQLPKGE